MSRLWNTFFLAVLCGALSVSTAAVSISDNFTSFDASLWTQDSGQFHNLPGPGFDARPDHLSYGATGVKLNLDNQPHCPSGCDDEPWAAGHLSSVASYCYGYYEIAMRSAHSPTGHTGTKAFTCYGMFSQVRNLCMRAV